MGQDRVPLTVAVGAAIVEGDGHGAAGTQQPQPRVDGRQGGVRLVKTAGSPPGETAQVEHHAVHGAGDGVALHMGVAVQDHPGRKTLLFQQGAALFHRGGLDVEGQYGAFRPRQTAQQGGVPAFAGGGVDAQGAGADRMAEKVMDHGEGVALHGGASLRVEMKTGPP